MSLKPVIAREPKVRAPFAKLIVSVDPPAPLPANPLEHETNVINKENKMTLTENGERLF